MIHVLHVVPTLGVGGIELALARVTRGLSAPDFRHSVACLTGEAAIAGDFGPDVPIHCLRGDLAALDQVRRLRRLIRDLRPSVIHARNTSAWVDVAAVRLLLRRRPPLVLSFHGTDHAGALPAVRWRMAALAARTATSVFTVSRPSKDMLARALRLPGDRIAVVPNGIDMGRFHPEPRHGARPDRIVLGTVGNLLPVKNQALLLRACAELLHSGHRVELRIAGEGPERPALARLARSLGIAEWVDLRGHVADVPAFLAGLDIFVLPSDSEAHPNALIEAMACALPCVASRVGGIPDVLTGDGVGRTFARGDVAGLVKILVELISAPDLRAAIGRGARARVEDQYSLDDMLRLYRRLYTEVAQS